MSSLDFLAEGTMEQKLIPIFDELSKYTGESGGYSLLTLQTNIKNSSGFDINFSSFGNCWEFSCSYNQEKFSINIDAATSTDFELFEELIELFIKSGLKDWKARCFDSSTGTSSGWVFEDGGLVEDDIELDDQHIVFSGKMQEGTREEMEELAEDYGAIVQKAVNGKTEILVIGDNVGQKKLDKAKSLGVKILTEKQFMDIIEFSPC
ncbi:BRCT domain-containing protein [Shewanella frigidimarina]|uniref:BRCT domain-containing protein n=1 Tax=Shewanella frigidimarina TaxID=56812 RepID=UPI003D7B25D1